MNLFSNVIVLANVIVHVRNLHTYILSYGFLRYAIVNLCACAGGWVTVVCLFVCMYRRISQIRPPPPPPPPFWHANFRQKLGGGLYAGS